MISLDRCASKSIETETLTINHSVCCVVVCMQHFGQLYSYGDKNTCHSMNKKYDLSNISLKTPQNILTTDPSALSAELFIHLCLVTECTAH